MKLDRIELVEMYVGDLARTAALFVDAFGFHRLAEAGPETGLVDRRSTLLGQGRVRIVVTEALTDEGLVAEHVRRHGDGVTDVAFRVEDAEAAYHDAVARGARPVHAPLALEDVSGRVVRAVVAGVGDVNHSFIQRDGPAGLRRSPGCGAAGGPTVEGLPCFAVGGGSPVMAFPDARRTAPSGPVADVDHVAFCLEAGSLQPTVSFYERVLGFSTSHRERVDCGPIGMSSEVVESEGGHVKFPMQEPLIDKPGGQIADYLRLHGGAGVQHIAFVADDMVRALVHLRERGVLFMKTPIPYYDALPARVGRIDEDLRVLRDLEVLVDRDRWGYLLQIFTRPLGERGPLFFELIQRKAARGFGSANIRALFHAVEREYGRPHA